MARSDEAARGFRIRIRRESPGRPGLGLEYISAGKMQVPLLGKGHHILHMKRLEGRRFEHAWMSVRPRKMHLETSTSPLARIREKNQAKPANVDLPHALALRCARVAPAHDNHLYHSMIKKNTAAKKAGEYVKTPKLTRHLDNSSVCLFHFGQHQDGRAVKNNSIYRSSTLTLSIVRSAITFYLSTSSRAFTR